MVLRMVHNTQNYWGFNVCPSSGILKTKKHNVAETGIFFRPLVRRETHTMLGPLKITNLNHWAIHVRYIIAIEIGR
jgi:hypothetical protein